MLSRLLRPLRGRQRVEQDEADREPSHSPSPGPANRDYVRLRHATADFTEAEDDEDDDESNNGRPGGFNGNNEGLPQDEDGLPRSSDVLPLFSATQLDSLPVYSIAHAIRIIVQTRTETTLTWEQLRSPQVSQFLVKPMQQQIRTQHFSRATIYALMANCLQFAKEAQLHPGNAGTSTTRSRVCELLAIKLLKEYTTRELIDALSYEFYPLQGIPGHQTPLNRRDAAGRQRPIAARTSTLEVAIRASAKHFLAHPLVVQQLEAIWNGAISFYSAADYLHRKETVPSTPNSPWPRRDSVGPDARTPLLGSQKGKEEASRTQSFPPGRRTVMLYDPRNASLFKLSRLRVPRYRQFFSTCSLAILIGLFLAVLIKRSSSITTLELVFWFWSAGFMLDELVGFNEQGFSLYIMSFWNIFDLGILLLLIIYYCLRIYGVFLLEPRRWNDNAYDALAANAILLLPRIFSILDHYQYFSQLLIAFRLMAVDLAAVFILVLISCSGFFAFFTLSRSGNDPGDVAYRIFQILMGFTPAAWEVWPTYNILGRTLMALFLIICHFVVVTILITVLTNSFTAIASNANEEHQFLFALNTISMVKNDALFSYIAPGNIFAWMLMPLRYCMPLQQFVALNRFVIKITHFPLLFGIYLYERFLLAPYMYEPTDLVENPGWSRQQGVSLIDPASRTVLFSPNVRVREESVVGFQKDRALDDLFRRAPDTATLRTQRRNERRKTQTAIRNWMDTHDGLMLSPHRYPTLDSRPGRLSIGRDRGARRFRQMSEARSAASDPADLLSVSGFPMPPGLEAEVLSPTDQAELKDNTDADGDDELITNSEEEEDNATNTGVSRQAQEAQSEDEDYFTTPVATRSANMLTSSSPVSLAKLPPHEPTPLSPQPGPSRRALHNRTLSTNTILYNPPQGPHNPESSPSPMPSAHPRPRPHSSRNTPADSPVAAATPGRRSPRRSVYHASRPRPILQAQTMPTRGALSFAVDMPARSSQRRLSSFDLASTDVNPDHAVGSGDDDTYGAVPSSFQTQMAMATGMMGPISSLRHPPAGQATSGDNDRMSRLVLARMKTLEEGLADVVREMRALQRSSALPSTAHNSGADDGSGGAAAGGVSGAGAAATIEVAGRRDRAPRPGTARRPGGASAAGSTTTAAPPPSVGQRRPPSWISMRDDKSGRGSAATSPAWGGHRRAKGKEVMQSDADDSDDDDNDGQRPGFMRRGSSF